MKNINKKIISLMLIMGIALLAACGSNDEADTEVDGDQFIVKVPLVGSDDNFVNKSYEHFKEIVEERTDGQIEVQVYGNGTLTPSEEQMFEMVENGTAEMSSVSVTAIGNSTEINKFNIFDIPFLFSDNDDLYTFLDGESIQDLFDELEDGRDLSVHGTFDMKGYNLLNSVRPIHTPDDVKGLKLRSSPNSLQIAGLEALGASPTSMAYGETFTGLQQGTIDGMHTASGLAYTDKFYEVSKYLTLTRHIALVHFVLINETFLNSLPDDLRDIFLEATEELVEMSRVNGENYDKDSLAAMEEFGIEIIELTDDELELFIEKSEPAIEMGVDIVGEEFYEKVVNEIEENQ